MANAVTAADQEQSLRVRPGVVLAVILVLMRFALPAAFPQAGLVGILGGVAAALIIFAWWLFFSRARWSDRLGALALAVGGVVATSMVLHESIATAGMGMLFYIYAIPGLALALVAAVALTRSAGDGKRRLVVAGALLLASGGWALVQTGGVYGGSGSQLSWRWAKTPEQRLLADGQGELAAVSSSPSLVVAEAEWPGFRGPNRDSVIPGIKIATDWDASPPIELWRRAIGPGWSSFAVAGDLLFTQEQRGEDEVVSAYSASSGEPVWRHSDPVRFWESNAGAGPRGTPMLRDGRVISLGATGILNVLEARDGTVLWSRDVVKDTGAKTPGWGFSGSPLVVGELVIVAVAGQLAAYDSASGEARWKGAASGGYSSPHPAVIEGVSQVLMLDRDGITSVDASDGTALWQHAMPGEPIVQPALTDDGHLLITTAGANGSIGTRSLSVALGPSGWRSEERWTSHRLKPYFNDFVVHEGHAYGFDGSIMAAIDLDGGQRVWKGGRYGHGQQLLLADQDLLLVLTEVGDLALVSATPERFVELARTPALEGKTWNHPVLVRDRLFVRNAEEMAAFKLPLADS